MNPLSLLHSLTFSSSSPSPPHHLSNFKPPSKNPKNQIPFPPIQCSSSIDDMCIESKSNYNPGTLDLLFMNLFRKKMVQVFSCCDFIEANRLSKKIGPLNQEVGWDSDKPGYDGLIEVANSLMLKSKINSDTEEAAVRILRSLFPPFLLELFQILIAPLGGGELAAIMVARVTAISCQWLMGRCTVNSVDLPDGSTSWTSGVLVERCKYLEESKCLGICINTCKLPTQTFFKDYMGVPLLMEPNLSDYSCQFKFGIVPPLPSEDKTLKEPCLEICPHASRRREVSRSKSITQCPNV